MRTLYFVRHGQYRLAGERKGSLTDLGMEQAGYAAQALRHLNNPVLVASTMPRAIETANIIAAGLGRSYKTSDLLREAIPSIPPRLAEQILKMMSRDDSITHETIHEDRVRVDQAFDTFFQIGDDQPSIAVHVCHGNIIRYLTCRALDINTDTWAKLNINHCGLTSFSLDEQGRVRLMTFNETRHIPLDAITD